MTTKRERRLIPAHTGPVTAPLVHDSDDYDGEPVCIRCGNGWPLDPHRPDYQWAPLCRDCNRDLGAVG